MNSWNNRSELTGKDLRKTARAAVTVLKKHGLDACLFGSAACAIYGMENREPNDIDIIVITEMDPEDLKDLIAESDQRFYLVPSVNPRNTYQVLWFSVSPRKSCKVDILVPGLLSIPVIPVSKIVYINQDIPVVPFLLLLLLKLRGWTDHRVDSRPRMRDKVEVDEGDIEELLELGVEEYKAHLDQESWLPECFVQEMEERVVEYVERWPDSKQAWRSLGL